MKRLFLAVWQFLVELWWLIIALIVASSFLGAPRWADASMITLRISDGDTFTLNGEKIRISNIDTPELFSPHCDAESRLAHLARLRLKALLGNGNGIELQREEKPDRFGRTLARVSVNGHDVGEALIAEGLASPWEGKRHGWCCG